MAADGVVVPNRFRAWQEFSYPLSNFSSFGTGGIGKNVFFPRTLSELQTTWRWAAGEGLRAVVVGGGSNLLFPDGEVERPIICVRRICDIKVEDDVVVAQCGAGLPKLASTACAYSLAGLEFAVDIPGTVGGAVMGNAGAYGSNVFEHLHEVEYLDDLGLRHVVEARTFASGYRHSGIDSSYCILGASFHMRRGRQEEIKQSMAANRAHRRQHQPHGRGSAGSIFKNPDGGSAWQLIDSCGLKGFRMGRVGVSEKHANWVVNYGGASSTQLRELIDYVHEKVLQETGVDLQREVRLRCWE